MPGSSPNDSTGYYCKIVADSIGRSQVRLTTMEICFPRYVLAEFNTHRMFSRNSASSRAIPVAKQIERVQLHGYMPAGFPVNKAGMNAAEYIYAGEPGYGERAMVWQTAKQSAIGAAQQLLDFGVHKQVANRLLEPFMWHTVIVTATDWDNFFNLRRWNADPAIMEIAELMHAVYTSNVPDPVNTFGWHLPFVNATELSTMPIKDLCNISAGRCAAVTLLNHDKPDVQRDLLRASNLMASGHMSPFEHQAWCRNFQNRKAYSGNFRGWTQYRKQLAGEEVFQHIGGA